MANICVKLFQIVTICPGGGVVALVGILSSGGNYLSTFSLKRATESERLALSDPDINSIRERGRG